ncbi:fimbrial protein [Xenorhabdus budapestensis]|uniref:Minor F1C fimbrial subunit SfaD n=1 Tax=Xenorhabdus budapestensis TaxID=290110 RepID=A0A2D0IW23_XENBU|nr:fimbrial protein [Xenorhabdus budapestensis]PHM26109.1 minor F1C fimbrial subunit SfaD [Xenorhabdus budapestensis]
MKKTLVSSFIAAILVSVSNISYAALPATTGTVKFEGKIVESTCTIGSDSDNIVDMGIYLKSGIVGTSGTEVLGSKKDFKIKLTGCPVTAPVSRMVVTLSGTNDTHNPNLLKIDSSGAEGIGIGVYSKSKLINFSAPKLDDININSADMEIPLQVAYVSNGETVTAGKANSTLSFSIDYK